MKTADILNKQISIAKDVNQTTGLKTITLGDWISACMDDSNPHAKTVKQIRAIKGTDADETKKLRAELKKGLPAAIIAAKLHHRKAGTSVSEKIDELTGLLAFDIDKKENPNMVPAKLRDKLSKVQQVIFCGLSASGEGIWGIIQVAFPDKLKQHYEQLKEDFKQLGITLDASKGGNPTDLRFYASDPDAYLSESYKVYDRLPKPKPAPKPKPIRYSRHTKAINPLQTAIRMIERATDGQKHHELLKAAHLAGGYIAAGTLTESEAVQSLENAIRSKGNIESLNNAQKTIRDGIAHGQTAPIEITPHQQEKYNKTSSIVNYFNSIDISIYNIELNGTCTPLPDFLSLNIPKALSGDKTAQKRLHKAMEVIKKDQQLMQSEASESLSAAPVADAV